MDLDRDKLLWMYQRMRQIREFENQLHADFAAGLIPGFVHLYAGEEAIAVGNYSEVAAAAFGDQTLLAHTDLMLAASTGAVSSTSAFARAAATRGRKGRSLYALKSDHTRAVPEPCAVMSWPFL